MRITGRRPCPHLLSSCKRLMLNCCSAVRRRHFTTPLPRTALSYQKQLRANAIGTFKKRQMTAALNGMSDQKRQNCCNKSPVIKKLATTNANDALSYQRLCEHTDCHG